MGIRISELGATVEDQEDGQIAIPNLLESTQKLLGFPVSPYWAVEFSVISL